MGVDAFATIVKNRCRHQLFISTAEIETIKTTACHQERRYRSAASQQQQQHHVLVLSSSSSSDDDSSEEKNVGDKKEEEEETTTTASSSSLGFRVNVSKLVTRIVTKPYRLATTIMPGDPSAIGQVIYDASYAAVEEVEKEASNLLLQRVSNSRKRTGSGSYGSGGGDGTIQSIVDDAFKPMEESLIDMEESLIKAKKSLLQAKISSYDAIETLQLVALEQQQQAENSVVVMEAQREAVIEKIREVSSSQGDNTSTSNSTENKILNLSELTFDDIDYESSEMAKPFLDFDSCLMTDAEPVVRVEKAPDNSRRIFAGIDILASTDDVWNVSVYLFI